MAETIYKLILHIINLSLAFLKPEGSGLEGDRGKEDVVQYAYTTPVR